MRIATYLRLLCCLFILFTATLEFSKGQSFPVPGGLVTPGVQTCFPFTVSGLPPDPLGDPILGPWPQTFIDSFSVTIMTSHPWTMEITLVSPGGTILTLSSFNGAGGSNYINTNFAPTTANSIIGVPAPMTGTFEPQQSPPGFSIFNGEIPNGVWQLCILDTLTDSTSIGPGPPGIGATSTASGTMGFGSAGCAPCSTLAIPNLNPIVIPACLMDPIDIIGPCIWANQAFDQWGWQAIALSSGMQVSSGNLYNYGASYLVTATDACGNCSFAISVTLLQIPDYPVNSPQLLEICQNATIDLNALMWVNASANPSWTCNGTPISFNDASAAFLPGGYVVNIPGSIGNYCPAVGLVDIVAAIPPDLGPDQTIGGCTAGSVDLTPLYNISNMTSNWYFNGNPVSNPASVSVNGNYMLVVDSANGCKDTAIVTLNYTPSPVLGADQSIDFCGTEPVNLTTLYNTTGYTPNWTLSGAPVSNPASVNVAGVYMLIADNVNGCADTALVTLNMLNSPALGPDQNIIGCTVAPYNLTLLYNTTGLTANWYKNGVPVANPTGVVVNGNYMLVASSAAGCFDTAMVSLNMSIGPALGADQSVTVCAGTSVNLTTLYSTGSFSTNWTLSGAPVATPAAITNGGIYTLIASNVNGCADTAVVTVTVSNPPSLGIDQVHDICSNTVLDLTSLYTTTGMTSGWTINSVTVPNPTTVSAAGIYTVLVTDANGCTDQATVTINSLAAPGLGPDQNTAFCPGAFADLTTLYTTTGFNIAWTLSGAPVANVSNVNVPGTYQLVATETNGCTDTANTIVTAATFPVIGADQQLTACDNQPVNLTSVYNTSGNIATWTVSGSPVANPAAVSTPGTYLVTCTNPAGCSATATVSLSINQAPVLGSDQAISACSGTNTDISSLYSLTGLTPQWSLNGNPVADPTAVSLSGNYQLIATNANNCSDTALVTFTVTNGPDLGADQSFMLCEWMTVNFNTLYNVSGLTAVWSLNGQVISNFTAIHDSGMYQLFVTDVNGCTDIALVTVENMHCECDLDFSYQGHCVKDPVTLTILADSTVLGAHWSFSNPLIPESNNIQPVVIFPSNDNVLVTLEAVLSCGTRIVEYNIKMEDCADSCRVYFPNAFTPNRDGKNEGFRSFTECAPITYEMEIWNRFGQVIFKSVDFSHAWDGKDDPEGVYLYTVNYQMPYQKKKTVTGRVTVLR